MKNAVWVLISWGMWLLMVKFLVVTEFAAGRKKCGSGKNNSSKLALKSEVFDIRSRFNSFQVGTSHR